MTLQQKQAVVFLLLPIMAACSERDRRVEHSKDQVASNALLGSSSSTVHGVVGAHSDLEMETLELKLGDVLQHNTYDLVFPFAVVGEDPIVITALHTSCGCTQATIRPGWGVVLADEIWPIGKEIPAGATGAIVATYQTGRLLGSQSPQITVRGNFLSKERILEVSANVNPFFERRPDQAKFTNLDIVQLGGANAAREISISGREPFQILRWKRIPDGFSVEEVPLDEEQIASGYSHMVRLVATDEMEEGRFISAAIAETSVGYDLVIPVNGEIQGPIRYEPQDRLSFGISQKGERRSRMIELVSNRGRIPEPQLKILGTISGIIAPRLEVVKAGEHFQIHITLSDSALPGRYRGVLKITFPLGSGLKEKEISLSARIR